jgi:hypothetical protein
MPHSHMHYVPCLQPSRAGCQCPSSPVFQWGRNRARLEELRWPVYRSVPELTRIVVRRLGPAGRPCRLAHGVHHQGCESFG